MLSLKTEPPLAVYNLKGGKINIITASKQMDVFTKSQNLIRID